jgi:hypothetical protein
MIELHNDFGDVHGPIQTQGHGSNKSPEWKFLEHMIDTTWEDLWSEEPNRVASAKRFINDGLDWLIEPTNLEMAYILKQFETPYKEKRWRNRYDSSGEPQKITWDGKTLTFKEWGERLNIQPMTVRARFNKWGECSRTFTPYNMNK